MLRLLTQIICHFLEWPQMMQNRWGWRALLREFNMLCLSKSCVFQSNLLYNLPRQWLQRIYSRTESPLPLTSASTFLLRGHFLGISISALACKEWVMTWYVHGTSYQLHIQYISIYSLQCISSALCLLPEQISVSAIWKLPYSARRIAVFGNRDISNDQKNEGKRGIFQSRYPSGTQWKLALYNIVNPQGCRGMLFCNVDILKGHGNVFGSAAVNWWKTEENNQASLFIPNSFRWDNRERKLAILLGVREYSHISLTICSTPRRTEIINLHCWLIVKNMAIILHT